MEPIRQGDVLFYPISSLPKGKIENMKECTVAVGEATGHHHTIYAKKDMKVLKVDNRYFIQTEVDVPLRHQEHEEVIIPKGIWSVGWEIERDPFKDQMRKTQD